MLFRAPRMRPSVSSRNGIGAVLLAAGVTMGTLAVVAALALVAVESCPGAGECRSSYPAAGTAVHTGGAAPSVATARPATR
jgi:hypothetical protein